MKEDINERIEKLQKTDCLKEAEKITGQHYSDRETSMLGFGLQMAKNAELKKLLDVANDVSFGCTVPEYMLKMLTFGFEKVLQIPFESDGRKENLYVLFEPSRGILLVFDTYTMSERVAVNGGNFYYNIAFKPDQRRTSTSSGGFIFNKDPKNRNVLAVFNDDFEQIFPVIPEQIYSYFEEPEKYTEVDKQIDNIINNAGYAIWTGHHDCREAVIHNILKMETEGRFVPNWKEGFDTVHILHHQDWKEKKFDETKGYVGIDELNRERLNMLPEWVQIQIGIKKNLNS